MLSVCSVCFCCHCICGSELTALPQWFLTCENLVYLCASEIVDFYFYSQGISKRLYSSPACLFIRLPCHLLCMCTYMCMCMHACMHVQAYVLVYVRMYVYIYMYVYACVGMRFLLYLRFIFWHLYFFP